MVTGWSFGHPSIELLCGKTLSLRYLLVTNIDLLYHDRILCNVYSCVYYLCVFLRWLQVHHLKIVMPPKEPRPCNGSSHLQQVYPFFPNVYVAHYTNLVATTQTYCYNLSFLVVSHRYHCMLDGCIPTKLGEYPQYHQLGVLEKSAIQEFYSSCPTYVSVARGNTKFTLEFRFSSGKREKSAVRHEIPEMWLGNHSFRVVFCMSLICQFFWRISEKWLVELVSEQAVWIWVYLHL